MHTYLIMTRHLRRKNTDYIVYENFQKGLCIMVYSEDNVIITNVHALKIAMDVTLPYAPTCRLKVCNIAQSALYADHIHVCTKLPF